MLASVNQILDEMRQNCSYHRVPGIGLDFPVELFVIIHSIDFVNKTLLLAVKDNSAQERILTVVHHSDLQLREFKQEVTHPIVHSVNNESLIRTEHSAADLDNRTSRSSVVSTNIVEYLDGEITSSAETNNGSDEIHNFEPRSPDYDTFQVALRSWNFVDVEANFRPTPEGMINDRTASTNQSQQTNTSHHSIVTDRNPTGNSPSSGNEEELLEAELRSDGVEIEDTEWRHNNNSRGIRADNEAGFGVECQEWRLRAGDWIRCFGTPRKIGSTVLFIAGKIATIEMTDPMMSARHAPTLVGHERLNITTEENTNQDFRGETRIATQVCAMRSQNMISAGTVEGGIASIIIRIPMNEKQRLLDFIRDENARSGNGARFGDLVNAFAGVLEPQRVSDLLEELVDDGVCWCDLDMQGNNVNNRTWSVLE